MKVCNKITKDVRLLTDTQEHSIEQLNDTVNIKYTELLTAIIEFQYIIQDLDNMQEYMNTVKVYNTKEIK